MRRVGGWNWCVVDKEEVGRGASACGCYGATGLGVEVVVTTALEAGCGGGRW